MDFMCPLTVIKNRANFPKISVTQSSLPVKEHRKGEKADCPSYWGITLPFVTGKILARILLNIVVPSVTEKHIPESFMVFDLRQVQEKCRKLNMGLFVTFVDLEKPLTW